MKYDFTKIDNIELEDVDPRDYPDLTDAHITSADYDGREMTPEELDDLNENYRDFVHEQALLSLI